MNNKECFIGIGKGTDIKFAAQYAVNVAKTENKDVTCDYNGIKIKVTPQTSEQYVINAFFSQAMGNPNIGAQQQKTR